MNSRLPVIVIFSIVGVTSVTAADESTVKLRETVETLIEKLDSDSRAIRVRSERELVRLGPQILPLLPPSEKLSTSAQRSTIRRVRIQLERKKARDSVLASRIQNLNANNLGALIKGITRQTGNKVTIAGTGADATEFKIKDDEFWPAIDRLSRKTSLRPTFQADVSGLILKPEEAAPNRKQLRAYSGPFRVTTESAQLRPIFGNEKERLVRIPISIMSEPRLRPLILRYSTQDVTALSTKTPLTALNAGANYELSMGRFEKQLNRNLEFRIPAAHPSIQISVKAQMTMLTAAGTEEFRFLDVAKAKGVARRRGGVTVAIRKVLFQESPQKQHSARVRVAVTYDIGGPAFESHQRWMLHNKAELQTNDGKSLTKNSGFDISLELDGAIEVEYRFDGLKNEPNDYRFVYEAPTLLINVPIKFEFKDIPIKEKS